MHNLKLLFRQLVDAAAQGCFAKTIIESTIAEVPLHRHPLGFSVARMSDDKGIGLRLHLWDSTVPEEQAGFTIHDHRFDLESYVICGCVEQEIFNAVIDPMGTERRYAVSYMNNSSRLDALPEKVRLEVVSRQIFKQGQQNILSAGVLHRLRAIADNTITLVLTTDRLASPIAIGPANGPATIVADRGLLGQSSQRVSLTVADAFVKYLG